MKIIKIFLVTLAAFVGLIFAIFVGLMLWFSIDGWTAESPSRIAKEAGFKLPAYEIVEQYDNMDRTASAWSEYDYKVKLKEPLSDKQIKKLDKLVEKDFRWTAKTENGIITGYEYEEFTDDKYIVLRIYLNENIVTLSFSYRDILS